MKIIAIDKQSTAQEIGLQPGDELRTINGASVRDILDYRFAISEEDVELEIRRNGETIFYDIEKDANDTLGLNFEPIKVRMCGNDCPFCFVDQNPANMRKSMYFRDEDFRLSFLAGHFVTLTNISRRDLQRIVRQRLTPLYISVHAIDYEVRKFLLGLRKNDHLQEKLHYLTSNGIELHTQIVVCPGINDGNILEETVRELASYYPQIGSIALVPLGLTKHREGLTKLKPVTPKYARSLLKHADELAENYRRKFGIYFVYPSDEFHILADQPIPTRERYDSFQQFENGVGMVRTFIENFHMQAAQMPRKLPTPVRATLVTGVLASGFIQNEIADRLNQIENLQLDVVVVENEFYGPTIRVTGLLTGQDILKNLQTRDNGDRIFLPGNCVNDKQIFLDDMSVTDMQTALGTPIHVASNDFGALVAQLAEVEKAA